MFCRAQPDRSDNYIRVPVDDHPKESIKEYLHEVCDFIGRLDSN